MKMWQAKSCGEEITRCPDNTCKNYKEPTFKGIASKSVPPREKECKSCSEDRAYKAEIRNWSNSIISGNTKNFMKDLEEDEKFAAKFDIEKERNIEVKLEKWRAKDRKLDF
jgi:hypothetical protein